MPLIIPKRSLERSELRPQSQRPLNQVIDQPNIAGAISDSVSEISKVIISNEDEKDKISAQNSLNSFNSTNLQLGYGSDEEGNNTGFFSKIGQNSIDSQDEYRNSLQLNYDSHVEGMSKNQRRYFDSKANTTLMKLNGEATRNVSKQIVIAKQKTLSAATENTIQDAQTDYSPDNLQDQLNAGILYVHQAQSNLGASPAEKIEAIDEYKNKFYSQVIRSAIGNNDPVTANKIFNENSKYLTPNDKITLRNMLSTSTEEGNTRYKKQVAQNMSDKYYVKGSTLERNLEKVSKIKDAEIREFARKNIVNRHKDQQRSDSDHKADIVIAISDYAEKGGLVGDLPPETFKGLKVEEKNKLKNLDFQGRNNDQMVTLVLGMTPEEALDFDAVDFAEKNNLSFNAKGLKKIMEIKEEVKEGKVSARTSAYKKVSSAFSSSVLGDDKFDREGRRTKYKNRDDASKQTMLMVSQKIINDVISEKERNGETTNLDDVEVNNIIRKATLFTEDYEILGVPPLTASKIIEEMYANGLDNIPGKTFSTKFLSYYASHSKFH